MRMCKSGQNFAEYVVKCAGTYMQSLSSNSRVISEKSEIGNERCQKELRPTIE